jgi:hypothetical protein
VPPAFEWFGDFLIRVNYPDCMTIRLTNLLLVYFLVFANTMYAGEPTTPVVSKGEAKPWESAEAAYAGLAELRGTWSGKGEGKWGDSIAEKTITLVLDGKAICRTGRSEYPVQEKNPEGELHEAVALITLIESDRKMVLTEYDNEGFIARYALDMTASTPGSSWVFELEQGENLPPGFSARLTIAAPEAGQVVEIFELDFSGEGYSTYLVNRLTRGSKSTNEPGCVIQ